MNNLDLYINIGFTIVINVLQTLNPTTQTKFRKVFLKVNKLISLAYATDEEFKKEWNF